MRKPTVHLNGTSREALLKQQEAVYYAASTLLDALAEATPNGRDYYVQDDAAIIEARNEHEARRKAVADIKADAAAFAVHISEQGN